MSGTNSNPEFYKGKVPSAIEWDGYFTDKMDAVNGYALDATISLLGDPTSALGAATKQYVDHQVANVAGLQDAPNDGTTYARNSAKWVQALPLSGGGLTGPLTLAADPVAALQPVSLQYYNAHLPTALPPSGPAGGSLGGSYPNPSLQPTGVTPGSYTSINATINAEGRITSVANGGATAAFPDAPNDGNTYGRMNSTWNPIVMPAASTTLPLVAGTAAVGTANTWARADHVHPTSGVFAPINSPNFTGIPTAPTATTGTSTAQIATTSFVADAVSHVSAGTPTVLPVLDWPANRFFMPIMNGWNTLNAPYPGYIHFVPIFIPNAAVKSLGVIADNVASTTGSIRLALYTTANGLPGALLAGTDTGAITLPNHLGWIGTTIPSSPLTISPGWYWTAFQASTGLNSQSYFWGPQSTAQVTGRSIGTDYPPKWMGLAATADIFTGASGYLIFVAGYGFAQAFGAFPATIAPASLVTFGPSGNPFGPQVGPVMGVIGT